MVKSFKSGDPKIYQRIYEGLSYHQTTGEVYHTNRSKTKFYNLYLDAVKNIASPRVLDVGCGMGTELFMLPKINQGRYFGVDISRPAIETAKQISNRRGERRIEFKLIDANKKLPFSSEFFDVIYALELVEHLTDPKQFLKDAFRLLRPNGRLILSTPNLTSLPNLLPTIIPPVFTKPILESRELDFRRHGDSFSIDSKVWDHEAHISLFGYGKWKKIFNDCNFLVDKVEGSSFFGGSRFISNRPFLLSLAIMVDSLIDKLPLKPYLQMCLIVSLKKHHD